MRWLLLKDLQILRRSPLLVSLLVLYPVALSLLVGFGVSRGPEKPKVAFANLVPADQTTFNLGGQKLDAASYADKLFDNIDPIRVKTRAQAVALVRSGKALGALIVPKDATERLRNAINLSGGPPPTLEVLYNAEDPVKRRYVQSTIESTLAEANTELSQQLTKVAAKYIDIVVSGGRFSLLGQQISILGPQRGALEQVARFARLASENLDVSGPILASIGQPVRVKQTVVSGKTSSLDGYAIVVAVTSSLLLITVLLAAGMLALEREEHAFGRLVRGLVSRLGLIVEKVGLAALCAAAIALLMLVVLTAFAGLDWGRAPLWIPAAAFAALGFASLGVAIGSLAREIRAASLLAVMLSLPIVVLGLIPSGTVGTGLYRVIEVISALFPFKPALQALDAAVNDASPGLAGPLLHLAILTVAFTALARLAIRRFA
jgi:ABC-type transport system involved in multi-copper enzyme maturation permease subunit